jgi:23S rRNA (pseudouridine1915-N3)-methyltransferase
MPAWINTGFGEFNKRLSKEYHLNLVEITPAVRSKSSSTTKVMAEEEKKIKDAIPKGALVVALDEKGKQFTSRQLADNLELWGRQGRELCLVIGGADGLSASFKKSADVLWSLSALTLPHALVRVIVAEQIYRAWSILNNHPYHRE